LIPGGFEVTVPVPVPAGTTLRVGRFVKFAVTVLSESMLTVHVVAVPLHAPDQPAKNPRTVFAVRVTAVFGSKKLVQVGLQLIPAGAEVTKPVPSPVTETVSSGLNTKFALTDLAASMVTTQVGDVPLHAPDQFEKSENALGVAVSVTTVPALYPSSQSAGQDIPDGLDVTVPLPTPAETDTDRG